MRTVVAFFAAVSLSPMWADAAKVKELYESILARPGARNLPSSETVLSEIEATIRDLPSNDLKVLLPLGRRCLESHDVEVRRDCLLLIMLTGLRPDSADLLGAYVDDLAKLLSEPAVAARQPAMFILSTLKPAMPRTEPPILAANLSDKANAPDQIVLLTAAVIQGAPQDAAVTHHVLEVVEERSDRRLKRGILGVLSFYKVENSEATSFLRSSLTDPDSQLRAAAVEAAAGFGSSTSNRFFPELSKIADDERETAQIRAAAASILQR